MKNIKGWSMRCGCHTYVTLFYDGEFVYCYDNSCGEDKYMEHVIEKIEKKTRMKFTDIPIIGSTSDFDGLRFLYGGFKTGEEIFAE